MTPPDAQPPEVRERIVTFRGNDLHLTIQEYVALKALTYDDPRAALKLALQFLARERTEERTP